jgi:hypothetical protein
MSQAYPLLWPKGWPRTEAPRRENSKFDQRLETALANLRHQIELMGGKQVVLSSNCTLGMDNPADPGVVAYFQIENQAMAIPCDRWRRVRDNIHAIALTVEAMRGMERWGAKHMITAMFSGFKALPQKASGLDFYAVLGLDRGIPLTEKVVSDAFRRKAMTAHPDKPTGSAEKWAGLREAHDMAMQNARSTK